ncbi:MAG: HDOD domain-containing protein [Myxococcota bacterium]
METSMHAAEVRKELADRFAAAEVALPLLGESVQRVLSAASDENADARSLADIIKRDQAFAGHILRVSNSPMYASSSPIVSLQQAVSRLGMKQVREVALLISMQTRVFDVAGFAAELKALFRHAVAAALFAQEIARSRRKNVEEAFLSGLLHDVGKPIVLQAIVDSKSPAARALRADNALVWAVVDDLHGLAGRALARAWSLPAALGDVIAAHHDLQSSLPAVHIVRLADDLAHFAMGDTPVVDEAMLRQHPYAAALNLYPEDLAALIAKRETIVTAAGAFA